MKEPEGICLTQTKKRLRFSKQISKFKETNCLFAYFYQQSVGTFISYLLILSKIVYLYLFSMFLIFTNTWLSVMRNTSWVVNSMVSCGNKHYNCHDPRLFSLIYFFSKQKFVYWYKSYPSRILSYNKSLRTI